MALTEKDVLYVADLAHLELTDEEVKKFVPQLDSILQYMQKLNQLDTTNVEPMAQVATATAENSALRPDQARRTFSQQDAMARAPEPGGGCFKVPRVIERS
ncbi:MAG: Asp-tRNA(Asn)/Glu-tRNA(Gln) amidotransferase subunit GatC [Acidobacteria bacterium]|nr:Asp-tRNA(Asn)/Glu-tRNA(Gln) amidotransferase subunit GatC [Acidobacteriota bacterium]